MKTRVIFGKDKETREIVAFFPEQTDAIDGHLFIEMFDPREGFCAAQIDRYYKNTLPVDIKVAESLRAVLVNAYGYDLVICKRIQSKYKM